MAWMSPNAVPYQQFVRSSAYSMVSYLKTAYHYHCVAMHPHWADGWNRPDVYQHFGFDERIFVEDMTEDLTDSSYIREYVSDRAMFEMIIEKFEKQKEDPLFLFGVTVQNHGGYSERDDSYEQAVQLTNRKGDYSRVDNYLSLIHQTDKAVEYLISYFRSVNEPVVIAFFGDHQPSLDEAFYAEIAGEDTTSLNAWQNRYKVPFFVWANYDMAEKTVECTSLNYLSTYVYEAAGISMPAYNRFLADMETHIPAINANGFYSKNAQGYLPFSEASAEEKVWLQRYEQLQYNSLFDQKQRNEIFFPVLP
jgi:phosphoglycerol transferase MdoB-like AlkP superfamily enzyme